MEKDVTTSSNQTSVGHKFAPLVSSQDRYIGMIEMTFVGRLFGFECDDFSIWDFDVLPFYPAIREEFLRWYLVPSMGTVRGTRSPISLEGVLYIYDWDTRSSILI